ncbi:MAG: VPLPA-CTERM sorting domain-containing protein, partial [Methylococcales bacterium]
KFKKSLAFVGLVGSVFTMTAQANTVAVSGTLNKLATGTTFDTWKVNIQTAGNFTVDVRAYEASQSNTSTAGYYTQDLNGDGELTWLDPDTSFYHDDGHLDATDAIVRCDDVANNCNSPGSTYYNGYTAATSPIVTATHQQSEASVDGSIHVRRDPWYDLTVAAGSYLFLIADYTLNPNEAAGGINGFGGTPDNFSPPSGFSGGITDHADYQVTFSSSTLNFAVNGNTITVSQVPVPSAVWLFGSAIAGAVGIRRRKQAV